MTTEADLLRRLEKVSVEIDRLIEEQYRLAVAAVEAGATWSTVGEAVGTSRQAAWKRFVSYVAPASNHG